MRNYLLAAALCSAFYGCSNKRLEISIDASIQICDAEEAKAPLEVEVSHYSLEQRSEGIARLEQVGPYSPDDRDGLLAKREEEIKFLQNRLLSNYRERAERAVCRHPR